MQDADLSPHKSLRTRTSAPCTHVFPTSSGTRRRHRTRARADIALAIFKVRRLGFQNEEFRRRIAMCRLKKAPLALDLSSLSWPTESNNMAREALGPVRCTPYRPTLLGRLISTGVLATNEMKHDYYLLCHGAIKTGMLKCAHGRVHMTIHGGTLGIDLKSKRSLPWSPP